MARYSYDARAYEERYRRVYEAGAEFWEEPVPTEALVKFLLQHKLQKSSSAIEFGCGEGRDSVFLAKRGLKVVSIDISRSALKRAKSTFKKKRVNVDLLVADVVNLPVRDETFELAVNVGCLNLMIVQSVRDRHLHESHRVLKEPGTYFSCNSAVDQSMSVEEFYKNLGQQPETLTSRRIWVQGNEQQILLPIIAAWPRSEEQYRQEFEKASFRIIEVDRVNSKPTGVGCVLVAEKIKRS
jgi:ubiquinone/menaquinone biosynthesis C-methylase UbiE